MMSQAKILDTIFNNVPIILLLVDGETRVKKINHAGIDFFKEEEKKTINALCGEVLKCVNALHGEEGCGENHSCALCPIRIKVTDTMNNGNIHYNEEGEMTVIIDQEKVTLDLLISTSPMEVEDQNLVLVSLMDITPIKRAGKEAAELEARIFQVQRMESIGNLAGGIAHDFNNILFPIIGLAEMMLEDLDEKTIQYQNAKEILNAGKRGSRLVEQILSFSRQSEHKLIPVHIQKIIKEVAKLIRATIPSSIKINMRLQKDCGPVLASPTQIHQVAMNLITNAYHAIQDESGTICIELRETVLPPEDLNDYQPYSDTYVELSIKDDGQGISEDILPNIFEPYFTTKQKNKGTGLGLAIVYGVVKSHNGEIKVKSKPGKGTCFTLYFPRIENPDEKVSARDETAVSGGSEHLMIVDDESAILRLETAILKHIGYRVSSFPGSVEALASFKENPSRFDLLLTDMTMPDMTGDRLAKEIRKIRPEIPIIICTGFSERIDEAQSKLIGINGFLMKPVNKAILAKKIREVLDNF